MLAAVAQAGLTLRGRARFTGFQSESIPAGGIHSIRL